MAEDVCARCTLPDCDDRSPGCRVRQLARRYNGKLRRGDSASITPEERTAYNMQYVAWTLDRAAEASEGGRPFKRGTPPEARP